MGNFLTSSAVRENYSDEIRVSIAIRNCYVVYMRGFSTSRHGRGETVPTKADICPVQLKLSKLILTLQAAEQEVTR